MAERVRLCVAPQLDQFKIGRLQKTVARIGFGLKVRHQTDDQHDCARPSAENSAIGEQLLINNLLSELNRLRVGSGAIRESVVREAFKDLL
ncbi:MAG: hypothetical protein ACR65T_15755 [Methylocystis sp.]|uniref:hypothetical protein n=1 Tax=Methylocystis sp. TaxID=1911079 RepID=UPI003DA2405E